MRSMKKNTPDLTLEQCDELREITESAFEQRLSKLSDEGFENAVEEIALRCNGDFSQANWKRNC